MDYGCKPDLLLPRAAHGLCENAGCSIQEIVMALNPTHLLWLDMEMTGLSPDTDRIIELAIVVTDADLNTVAEGPVLVVHQPDEVMNAMDNWNKGTHGKSGLIDRVKASQLSEAEAELQMLDFVKQHVPPRTSPMCGNSICQDRRFMARCMPQLEAFFHYRNLDVSTLKELAKRWRPGLAEGFKKSNKHEALADIYESIDELKFYREHFIRSA
jgi:oligoribonuclease